MHSPKELVLYRGQVLRWDSDEQGRAPVGVVIETEQGELVAFPCKAQEAKSCPPPGEFIEGFMAGDWSVLAKASSKPTPS